MLGFILLLVGQAFIWPGAWLLKDGARRWAIVDAVTGACALVIGLSMVAVGISLWGHN